MAREDLFWDRIASGYSKKPVVDEAAYQKKLQVTREYFRPDMEVLEFGCGTGSTAISHAPYVNHILAIDISSKMIDIAQKKADEKHIKNVTFKRATIDEVTVPDGSLDVVMGHSILHLLENKEEVIAKVYRMLKPGGVFVSSTTCLGGAMKILKPVVPIGRLLGLLPVLRFFSVEDLKGSMIDAGFEIDYEWQPAKNKAVFLVAKKVE
jgi:ubiquinone/menaquinone biosynthesis C-methylase UbiE